MNLSTACSPCRGARCPLAPRLSRSRGLSVRWRPAHGGFGAQRLQCNSQIHWCRSGRAPRAQPTPRLTIRSSGQPPGYRRLPLTSNVKRHAQRSKVSASNTRWLNAGHRFCVKRPGVVAQPNASPIHFRRRFTGISPCMRRPVANAHRNSAVSVLGHRLQRLVRSAKPSWACQGFNCGASCCLSGQSLQRISEEHSHLCQP